MTNTYNNLEEYILLLLSRLDIRHPHQLNIDNISERMGMSIHHLPYESMYVDNNFFLDSRKVDEERWQDFGHELCHALWHAGDQALIPLSMLEYQEWKAENFAQHLCIPSFLLRDIKLPNHEREAVWLLQETFGVTHQFAQKRLQQYLRNLIYR